MLSAAAGPMRHHDLQLPAPLAQGDIADSYPGILEDLTRLKAERSLYAVHNADLRDEVLYARCDRHVLSPNSAFAVAFDIVWCLGIGT